MIRCEVWCAFVVTVVVVVAEWIQASDSANRKSYDYRAVADCVCAPHCVYACVCVCHSSIWYRQIFIIYTLLVVMPSSILWVCELRTDLQHWKRHSLTRTCLPLVNVIYSIVHTLSECKLLLLWWCYKQCRLHVGTVRAIPCIDFHQYFTLKPVCLQTHTNIEFEISRKRRRRRKNNNIRNSWPFCHWQ